MRIECPSCLAAYDVPDQKITGKKVRCARCGTDWAPTPPAPAEPPVIPMPLVAVPVAAPAAKSFLATPEPARVAPAAAAAIRKPAPRRGLLISAWIATIVLVAAIVAVADVRREAVMNAWPPSQRLYAWVGLR